MKKQPPKVLDAIADVVLRYRPKPKTLPARRRKRRASKIERDGEYRRCTKSSCRYVNYTVDCGPGLCCPRCGNPTERADNAKGS